jgi:hypothetical protein
MNAFVMDIFSHLDPRNPRDYSIQVSSGNLDYTTVASGTNPDSEGSSYKYVLAAPATARYVRLKLIDGFGGSTLIFADFGIGLLAPIDRCVPATQAAAVVSGSVSSAVQRSADRPARVKCSRRHKHRRRHHRVRHRHRASHHRMRSRSGASAALTPSSLPRRPRP